MTLEQKLQLAERNKNRRIHPAGVNHRYSRHLKTKYGMALESYVMLLASQQGCCAICRLPQEGKRLAVDHNHTTGAVRGLLCETCNKGLGQLKDSISLLEQAIEYLRKYDGSV